MYADSATDECCTPVLPPEARVPRCSIRHARGGFCAALTADCEAMLSSGQLPVLKGVAKVNTEKYCASSVADPPPGSVLDFLVRRLPPLPPPSA